jgi:hypothetical protein
MGDTVYEVEKAKHEMLPPQRFGRSHIGCFSVIFSPFVGGLMLYWNWKQLAEQEKANRVLLAVFVGIPLVQVLYAMVVFIVARNAEIAVLLTHPIAIWLISLLPLDFLYRRYHKVYAQQHGNTKPRHPISLGCFYIIAGGIVGAIWMSILAPVQASVLDFFEQGLPPQTYVGETVRFQYPGGWKVLPPGEKSGCVSELGYDCLLELRSVRNDVVFYTAQINPLLVFGQSLEMIETNIWTFLQSEQPRLRSLAQRTLEVDGEKTLIREYYRPTENQYGAYAIVMSDIYVFVFHAEYRSTSDKVGFLAVLDSIDFIEAE